MDIPSIHTININSKLDERLLINIGIYFILLVDLIKFDMYSFTNVLSLLVIINMNIDPNIKPIIDIILKKLIPFLLNLKLCLKYFMFSPTKLYLIK